MKQQLPAATGAFDTVISLQQLVSNLVNSSLPTARYNNTCVVNEVEQGIVLGSDMHKAIDVISDILRTVVANSRNGNIHITAQRYRDVVILDIQERNNYNGYALSFSIGSIEQDATSAGGYISMKGSQQKVTTISFSFPDNMLAA